MAVFLAPDPIQSTYFIPGSNTPANGGQVFFYIAGSSTKQTVYKDSAGGVAHTNPIVLDSGGNIPSGGEVWFTSGVIYKAIFAPSTDSDPPVSPYWTKDNLTGINDVAAQTGVEWLTGPTGTFVSTTSFTVAGDQTSIFQAGRRVKTTNTGGTIYSTVISSAFGALTTVVVSNDSGVLDSGLTGNAVSYGLLSSINPAVPLLVDTYPIASGSADKTKKARLELDGLTSSTVRVGTWPDYDFRFMSQTKGADVAASTSINLDTVTGDLIDVTGSTGISSIALAEGKSITARFTGSLTISNSTSMVLPGNKNIVTVAGDIATFRGYAAGVVRCSNYQMFPGIVYETAVVASTGTPTAVPFSSIPSGVRRITMMLSGVSTNGTSDYLFQLGTGGAATTSGYLGAGGYLLNANVSTVNNYTTGFGLPFANATVVAQGSIVFTLLDISANTWICSGVGSRSDTPLGWTTGGSVTLGGALDYLRLTTDGGVNTFDAGTINVCYER
jgi:hypothetical protein